MFPQGCLNNIVLTQCHLLTCENIVRAAYLYNENPSWNGTLSFTSVLITWFTSMYEQIGAHFTYVIYLIAFSWVRISFFNSCFWGRISSACFISMRRNDINWKYVYIALTTRQIGCAKGTVSALGKKRWNFPSVTWAHNLLRMRQSHTIFRPANHKRALPANWGSCLIPHRH